MREEGINVTSMQKPGNIERRVIAAVAFLMIASGVGTFVSVGLQEGARYGHKGIPVGYICGIHGIAIIVPGFLGLLVVLGCGCCNTRPAYFSSFVFDIIGLVFYTVSIIVLALIFELAHPVWPSADCAFVQGKCSCPNDYKFGGPYDGYRISDDFDNNCDRINMFYACRTALFCMWAFGLLFTIIHLVLVARLSCKLRSETPGQVLLVPGQNGVLMSTLAAQDSAQVYTAPNSAYIAQPQTSSIHGAAPVGVPSTGAWSDQPPPYSLQVGDGQPSSKSAAPPV